MGERLLACWCLLAGGTPRPSWREGLRIFCGATLGMGPLTYLSLNADTPVLVASFGASACLVFVVPRGPFSQPRNVVGGHVVAAAAGVAVAQTLGCTWYGAALAVAAAIIAMLYTATLHPPAAATALIAVLGGQGLLYPLVPVAVGAALLSAAGAIYNRLTGAAAGPAGQGKAGEAKGGVHKPFAGSRA
jgi:CBS domain-containing membrane protein